jgi:hypothetical protein
MTILVSTHFAHRQSTEFVSAKVTQESGLNAASTVVNCGIVRCVGGSSGPNVNLIDLKSRPHENGRSSRMQPLGRHRFNRTIDGER